MILGRTGRSLRPQRPIWQSAFDPAPSPPDSLCVHNCFDFRFYGFYEIFLIIVSARPFVNPKFSGMFHTISHLSILVV